MKYLILSFAFCLIPALSIISAQTKRNFYDRPPQNPVTCGESVDKAEYYFKYRKYNLLANAEHALNNTVQKCPNISQSSLTNLKKQLLVVQEEQAERNLFIALYYLKMYHLQSSGLTGACSRLKLIAEKYPNFSKITQVQMLLGESSDCAIHFKN